MKLIFLFLFLMPFAFAQKFYLISETSIKGSTVKLEEYKGKVVLIVNIASQCGYTSQLEGLEKLYLKYKNKNFVVLGVPTNDFGGQTPENDSKMLEFCQKNYQVTFPLLAKKTIQGEAKRPLYVYLTQESPVSFRGDVGWNFEKFLINKSGEVIGRFKSSVSPQDSELVKKIEASL